MKTFEASAHEHYPTATTFGHGSKVRINQNTLTGDETHHPEKLHYHKESTQLFFVTKGELHIEVESEVIKITPGLLLQVEPGEKYRTMKAVGETDVVCVGTFNEPGDRVLV